MIDVAEHNKPVAVVSPCEGTGYEIGSLSLIAGAKHMDEAKKFYDWALTSDAQKIAATTGSFQIPSNPATPVPPEAPDLSKIKLIEYDFAKYGSSETRKRLLGKWTDEEGEMASVRFGPLLLTLAHHGAVEGAAQFGSGHMPCWWRPAVAG